MIKHSHLHAFSKRKRRVVGIECLPSGDEKRAEILPFCRSHRKCRQREGTPSVLVSKRHSARRMVTCFFFCTFVVWSNCCYVFVAAFFVSPRSMAQKTMAILASEDDGMPGSITSRRRRTRNHGWRQRTILQQSSSSPSSSSSSTTPPLSAQPQSSKNFAQSVLSSPSAAHFAFADSFRNILASKRTSQQYRQRFVTGRFPVIVTVEEDNPNRRWLNLGRRMQLQPGQQGEQISTSIMLVNGTNIDRSLASYDRFQWLDEFERRELHDRYATVSMELLAEISIDKPGYLQILQSHGAGSSAATSRKIRQQEKEGSAEPLWNRRWRNRNEDAGDEEEDPQQSQLDPDQSPRDRLWSTGFSLTSPKGLIKSVDISDGHIDQINPRSESMITWPNEITKVPNNMIKPQRYKTTTQQQQQQQSQHASIPQDALLVADGFLVPGKDRGGIYLVQNPSHKQSEWSIPLTDPFSTDRWFYHKAVWVDLTGDGRQSILTARAKLRKVASTTMSSASTSSGSKKNNRDIYLEAMQETEMEENRPKNGQLIWLEMPKPHHYDVETGTPLEKDGTTFDPFDARHLPWKERILATGPDVAFAVANMNPDDENTVEVLASQFFDEKVTLHSIRRGPSPEVIFSRVIDDSPGAAFGGILVDLEEGATDLDAADGRPRVINSGSTIKPVGGEENTNSSFSHFLVTSHEFNSNSVVESSNSNDPIANNMMATEYKGSANGMNKQSSEKVRGGSLLAYKVPRGSKDAWKTEPWVRTTIASGFQVKQQIWNMINPGAPGFAYAFHAHRDDAARGKRPMIAVAGDCAESAYIFRPQQAAEGAGTTDPHAEYKLMCEIKCGATVGSIAVGYGDLCSAEQESGYAKIYIPCFEKDKVLVFALGSGEEEDTVDFDDSGW